MTLPSDSQEFHIDLFGRLGLIGVVIFTPVLWLASGSSTTLVIGLAFLVVAALGSYFICTVVVTSEGIVLYRANKALWEEVTGASRVSFFGLPYLKIQRGKGFKWWVPLYLTKPEEFRLALAARAPVGNPLHDYAVGTAQG